MQRFRARIARGLVSTVLGVAVLAMALPVHGQVPTASPLLYLSWDSGVTAVDASTGHQAFTAPAGVPSGDWSRLASTTPAGSFTNVRTVNATTGATVGLINVPGRVETRVVSYGGDLAALSPHPRAVNGRQPGRGKTELVVASTNRNRQQRYELDGNIEPEAFSSDGRSMFVIEYFPPLHPNRYQVRQLDLSTGALSNVPSHAGADQGQMPGIARRQVMSPDGSRLYTLYTSAGDGTRYSFVHVLDLDQKWAHCVDLPFSFGDKPAAMAITVNPDGSRIYVADGAQARIAEISSTSLTVDRFARIPLPQSGARPVATAGTDRIYVAADRTLTSIDANSLRPGPRTVLSEPARSMVVVDGYANMVYVAQRRAVVGILATNGRTVSSFPVELPRLTGLGYQVPANTSDTVKCAC
jgi:hypothetical protein